MHAAFDANGGVGMLAWQRVASVSAFGTRIVGALVQLSALDGQAVLGPKAFDVNQGRLPLTEQQMLQRTSKQLSANLLPVQEIGSLHLTSQISSN